MSDAVYVGVMVVYLMGAAATSTALVMWYARVLRDRGRRE